MSDLIGTVKGKHELKKIKQDDPHFFKMDELFPELDFFKVPAGGSTFDKIYKIIETSVEKP